MTINLVKYLSNMKETSIEELFKELWEFAKHYQSILGEKTTEELVEMLNERERIIKEITTKIEENVLRDVMELVYISDDIVNVVTEKDIKSLAESRDIKL